MKKIRTFAGMFIVGILITGALAVAMFFVGVKPLALQNKIMTKGTEAIAVVDELIESNTTINNSATYHLQVTYVDAEGNTKSGKTLDFLSLDDSQEIYDLMLTGKTVKYTIKYIGDDIVVGKSLFSTGGMTNLMFSIAFAIAAIICVGFVAMLVKTTLKASAMNKALETGETYPGVFLETGKSMIMGNTRYYSVTYEYTNDEEDVILVKSPKNYTNREVENLRIAKNFDVKAVGKVSVIAHDFTSKPITAPAAPRVDPFN